MSFHHGKTWHGSGKNPSDTKGISLPLHPRPFIRPIWPTKSEFASSQNSNRSNFDISKQERISLVVHLIRSDSVFIDGVVGYIYGRYKVYGSNKMDETFFPISYTKEGYRSPMLMEFCKDALV